MKKIGIAVFGVALAVAASAAQTASAAMVRWTITGTVSNSLDQTGLFGAPGGSLDGQAFRASFLFDTSAGGRMGDQLGFDIAFGGTQYGPPNPTLSAQLKIAGHTQAVNGESFSVYVVCPASNCGGQGITALASAIDRTADANSSTDNYVHVGASYAVGSVPGNLESPFALSNTTGISKFQFETYNLLTQSYDIRTFGDLNVNHISARLVDVAPVPLPAAGFALIAGLGGLGLIGRRRRSTAA